MKRDDALHSMIEADLRAARSFELSYDLERGAARFMTTVGVIGVATTVVATGAAATSSGAAASAKVLTGTGAWLGPGLVAKMLAVVTLSSVVVATSVPAPRAEARAFAAACSASDPFTGPSPIEPTSGALAAAPASPGELARSEPAASGDEVTARLPAPVSARTSPVAAGPRVRADQRAAAFAREVVTLAEERDLLRRDPAAALDRANTAERGAALAEEHEIVAIRALVALGRDEEASARAKQFVARHPTSPFVAAAQAVAGAR